MAKNIEMSLIKNFRELSSLIFLLLRYTNADLKNLYIYSNWYQNNILKVSKFLILRILQLFTLKDCEKFVYKHR